MAGAAQEREALFAAAERLAPGLPLAKLSTGKLCAEAKLPAVRFKAHFKNLTDFLLQSQQRFMNGLRDRIVQRTGAAQPGMERIRTAAETFLDGCQEQHALRSWFIETRTVQAELMNALAAQNRVYGVLVAVELKLLRWPHPVEGAQLWIAMVMEASLAEYQAQRVLPDVRETLWDFLRIYG